MNGRLVVILVMMTCVAIGCATTGGMMLRKPLSKATIELWRDADDKCHTNTTPFFAMKKNSGTKTAWKIIDDVQCLEGDLEIEVRFKTGQPDLLPACTLKGKSKIDCDLNLAVEGQSKYSVFLGSEEEDPVLEIESP